MGRKSYFSNEEEKEEYRKHYRKIYYSYDNTMNKIYCPVCQIWINKNNYKYHINTSKHNVVNCQPRYEINKGEFIIDFNI